MGHLIAPVQQGEGLLFTCSCDSRQWSLQAALLIDIDGCQSSFQNSLHPQLYGGYIPM